MVSMRIYMSDLRIDLNFWRVSLSPVVAIITNLQMATGAIHVVSEMQYQAKSYFACEAASLAMIAQQ